jgi:hypothetical protein
MSHLSDDSASKSLGEEACSLSSLDALLGHVQGNAPKVGGDAALARLSKPRLEAIELGARTRVEDCLNNIQALARLLAQVLLETDRPIRPADAVTAAQHLGMPAQDYERWNRLAEHALMYRMQRPLAIEVAKHWADWSRHLGEWPDSAV